LGYHIKNNGTELACDTNDRQERCIVFWQGDTRERDHLKDLGINSIMLKWIFKKCDGGCIYWICLSEDRDS
jgi:hypothetical protein